MPPKMSQLLQLSPEHKVMRAKFRKHCQANNLAARRPARYPKNPGRDTRKTTLKPTLQWGGQRALLLSTDA